jgi:hypothetical protein
MTLGIGFGVERIGLAALRWPKAATALILALLVLIGASLPQLRFDDDIHRVFLSDSALSDAQRQYEAAQDLVLSRLRSGLSTHLCGLSLKCQGAFPPEG